MVTRLQYDYVFLIVWTYIKDTYIDVQLRILRLCTTDYVISTRIFALGKYICSNFNINYVLQKNGFCRFISDQDKNITSRET